MAQAKAVRDEIEISSMAGVHKLHSKAIGLIGVLFLTPYIEFNGLLGVLFEQHAFLLPAPLGPIQ